MGDHVDLEMPRLTSAAPTSTVAEASLGFGSGSTSAVDEETVAVLVMPSPISSAVTSIDM